MDIDVEKLDDLLVYLKLVEKMNRLLFLMYGIRTLENDAFSKYYYTTDELSDAFFRITGYEHDKSTQKLIVMQDNGLLSVKIIKNIYDITYDLSTLLEKYYELIRALKLYRNKAQHSPHKLQLDQLFGNNTEFKISFEYGPHSYTIDSETLCHMIVDFNKIIIRLLDEVKKVINLHTREILMGKPKIASLFMQEKYVKFNELIQDKDKIYIADLMN